MEDSLGGDKVLAACAAVKGLSLAYVVLKRCMPADEQHCCAGTLEAPWMYSRCSFSSLPAEPVRPAFSTAQTTLFGGKLDLTVFYIHDITLWNISQILTSVLIYTWFSFSSNASLCFIFRQHLILVPWENIAKLLQCCSYIHVEIEHRAWVRIWCHYVDILKVLLFHTNLVTTLLTSVYFVPPDPSNLVWEKAASKHYHQAGDGGGLLRWHDSTGHNSVKVTCKQQ